MTTTHSMRVASLLTLSLVASAAMAGEYDPLTERKIKKLEHIVQTMVDPPMFPEHTQVADEDFKVVQVYLPIEEKKITIDDNGTEIWALTYNGTVPGPMIVVHEGDYVEITLHNKSTNSMEHNIDLHASTGALGAGGLTHVQPGEQVVLRFRATKAGSFVYHCAPGGAMIPWHVVHGMNGAITVLPREGLTDGDGNPLTYDRAYYIGEQDFYIPQDESGAYKTYENPMMSFGDDVTVMNTLTPTHVVFNGRVGALTGDNSMTANVGETVLFVHSQANRDTRPHIIGGHGEYVWPHGSYANPPLLDLETWFIPGGTAGAALYTFKQPGVYAYVNHNLIEAVLKGATGHVVVEGDWNDDLMKQTSKPVKVED